MDPEIVCLIHKIQIAAQELEEDANSSPFDIDSIRDYLSQVEEAVKEYEDYVREE